MKGEVGEVVVPEGDRDGDEDVAVVLEKPPPRTHVLPLPEWPQKALGKDSAV